jgi:hypothetical protein
MSLFAVLDNENNVLVYLRAETKEQAVMEAAITQPRAVDVIEVTEKPFCYWLHMMGC